jgi:hypothetical protein
VFTHFPVMPEHEHVPLHTPRVVGLTFFQNFCAGWASAAVARTVTCPLEFAKLQMQITGKTDMGKLLRSTFRRDGMAGLFRGNVVSCLRIPLYSYSAWYASIIMMKLIEPNHPALVWLIRTLGGVFATFVSHFLDTLKVRLTLRKLRPKVRQCPLCYFMESLRDGWECLTESISSEGVLALFHGIIPALLSHVPQAITRTLTMSLMALLWGQFGDEINETQAFISGVVSATVAESVWLPMDTLRRIRQAQRATEDQDQQDFTDVCAPSVSACLGEVLQRRGLGGLWSGWVPNLAKQLPYNLCTLVCYESLSQFFLRQNLARMYVPETKQ